jgi:hypothetical protein
MILLELKTILRNILPTQKQSARYKTQKRMGIAKNPKLKSPEFSLVSNAQVSVSSQESVPAD